MKDTNDVRVLVMLGGIPLWGQERGNIQVFAALKGHLRSLFVTHKAYGHESIQPMLDRLGLAWTTGTYPGLISEGWVFVRGHRGYARGPLPTSTSGAPDGSSSRRTSTCAMKAISSCFSLPLRPSGCPSSTVWATSPASTGHCSDGCGAASSFPV